MNDPALYTKSNQMSTKDNDESLRHFAPHFRWGKNEKILDVGCGPGDNTTNVLKRFAPADAVLVGGDISKEMVDYATKEFGSSQLEFKCMDIVGSLVNTWTPESFDKIFSFFTLHWVQNHRLALENMYKLLKPGGQLFLTFLARIPIFEVYKRLSEDERWAPYMTGWKQHVSKYQDTINPEEDFRNTLVEVNYKNISVQCLNKNFDYGSYDIITNLMIAVNPFLKRIPADLLASYKEELFRVYFDVTDQKDGGFEMPYSTIVAFAEK